MRGAKHSPVGFVIRQCGRAEAPLRHPPPHARAAVNKQLNDKERVAAALENPHLLDKVMLCLSGQTAI